jgi:hypothetical protein
MDEIRYSHARMVEAMLVAMSGDPDPAKICTSHVNGKTSRCGCKSAALHV